MILILFSALYSPLHNSASSTGHRRRSESWTRLSSGDTLPRRSPEASWPRAFQLTGKTTRVSVPLHVCVGESRLSLVSMMRAAFDRRDRETREPHACCSCVLCLCPEFQSGDVIDPPEILIFILLLLHHLLLLLSSLCSNRNTNTNTGSSGQRSRPRLSSTSCFPGPPSYTTRP